MAPPPNKRRKVEPVAELTFDPSARAEYLTGFHKRKVHRAKHAQEVAKKKEKEDRVIQRKEIRDQRKRELEEHVAEVNALLARQEDGSDDEERKGKNDRPDEDDEWAGIEENVAVDETDEYIDEGKFTVVTVKELDDIRDFESDDEDNDEDGDKEGNADSSTKDNVDAGKKEKKVRKVWIKGKLVDGDDARKKQRSKKRNFRYESKIDRQAARRKIKNKKEAAAKARKGEE